MQYIIYVFFPPPARFFWHCLFFYGIPLSIPRQDSSKTRPLASRVVPKSREIESFR
jgi:hypothetical protein